MSPLDRRKLIAFIVGAVILALLGVLLAYFLTRGKAAFDLASAYANARPGDTICVPSGSYGAFRLAYDPAKEAGPPVTIQPCTGATPTLSRLELGYANTGVRAPKHVVVRDLKIDYTAVWDGAVDIELNNLKGRGFDVIYGDAGPSWATYPDNVRIVGGEFGPCEAVSVGGECTSRMIGTNITVDGAYIHDITSNDLVTYHVDGIFVRGCRNCAIKHTVFARNDITNVRIQNCCGLPTNENVVLEGNWLGVPLDGKGGIRADGVDIDTPTPGFIEREDIYEPGTGPIYDPSRGQFVGTFERNKMTNVGPCIPTATYRGNTTLPWSYWSTGQATWDGGYGNVQCGDSVKATQAWPYYPPDLSWRPPTNGTTTVPTTSPTTTTAPTTVPTTTTTKPPATTTVVTTVTQPPVTVTQPPTTVTVAGGNSRCQPEQPTQANPDYLCKPVP